MFICEKKQQRYLGSQPTAITISVFVRLVLHRPFVVVNLGGVKREPFRYYSVIRLINISGSSAVYSRDI